MGLHLILLLISGEQLTDRSTKIFFLTTLDTHDLKSCLKALTSSVNRQKI